MDSRVQRRLAWWLVCLVLSLMNLAVAAAPPPYPNLRFTRHDGPEGPFRQSFSQLYADRDGFLWGATLDSAFRFDGHRFQQWPVAGGNSATFSEDAGGRLWVLTEQELWRFDPQRVVRMRVPLPRSDQSRAVALAHSEQGTWLLMTDGSLYQYSNETGAFRLKWRAPSHAYVISARATPKGVLWWRTDQALWRFSPKKNLTPLLKHTYATQLQALGDPAVMEGPDSDTICLPLKTGLDCVRSDGARVLQHSDESGCSAVQWDSYRRLHVLCGDTLWSQTKVNASRLVARLRLARPPQDNSHVMQLDKNGRLWLALGNDYGVFDPETGAYQTVETGQEDSSGRFLPASVFLTNLMLVHGDNIWFALNGKGLYRARLTPLAFDHWAPPAVGRAVDAPLLRAVYEDRHEQKRELWLADARAKVWRIPIDDEGRLGAGIPVAVKSPSETSECRAIIRAPGGPILYATQDRLYAFNEKDNALAPLRIDWPDRETRPRFCGLHADGKRMLWVFGEFGIAKLQADESAGYRAIVYPSGKEGPWDLYDTLYEGSDGWWWIPYRNGIQRFDPSRNRWDFLSRSTAPLAATWIHQVLEQPVGIFWLATRGGGLQRIDLRTGSLNEFERWGVVHAPPESESPIRYSMLADRAGRLWLAGGRGLDRYDPASGYWMHFDFDEGLQQIEFNHGAAVALSDGHLVFVGLNGLTIVHPELVGQDLSAPEVKWQGAQINGGEAVAVRSPLVLHDEKQGLTLHYLALDYDAPKSVRYRYRIRNDQPWIDVADQRQLHFAGLSSGDYTLEVQAAYNHGDWPLQGTVLAIRVPPPWYRSWIAIALLLSVLMAAAMIYVTARNRQQRKLESEVDAKTAALRQSHAMIMENFAVLQRSRNDLKEQKLRLELALGARERIFRLVSHEFRTPLTKIVLPLDEMIRQEGDRAIRDRLKGMRRNTDRLLGMVDTLLDKARASSELKTQFDKVMIENEVITAKDDFIEIFAAKRQKFTFSSDFGAVTEAMLTRDCLTVILDNLLSNAAKYTPEGGEIRLDAQITTDSLVLQVSDTGVGMDQTTCAALFSPFFRGGSARASGVVGHGLGLHLVFDVVHLNGGDISVESAPDNGATFTVRLPLMADFRPVNGAIHEDKQGRLVLDEVAGESSEWSTRGLGIPKSVLIIEDDPELRTMLAAQLSNRFRCLEAGDADDALGVARKHLPDMILCDIGLPGADGYEVCMALKSDEETAHIPVIFLTAYASDNARLQALRVFGDDYITKPPCMEELTLKISNRLRTRDALMQKAKDDLAFADVAVPDVATKDQELVAKATKFRRDVDAALEANYAKSGYGASALAQSMNRSTRTLQRHMEIYGLGIAPLEYIRDFRLKKAAKLLQKDRRVSVVATMCGLEPKTFSAVFKERFGKTPSEWRKANLAQEVD